MVLSVQIPKAECPENKELTFVAILCILNILCHGIHDMFTDGIRNNISQNCFKALVKSCSAS